MSSELPRTAVATTVHCDDLIEARVSSNYQLARSKDLNQEVYDFLASAPSRNGIGFWKPGSGIIHQTVLENYAFPSRLMIGIDSHTPNAGGLGICAVGVGSVDAADIITKLPWHLKWANVIGVHPMGKLSGWLLQSQGRERQGR